MDEKEFKYIVEKSDFLYDELKSAMDYVYVFIKENNLILYGGMALDLALKEAGHDGIYSDSALPDFDFYSPNSYNDSNRLAMILFQNGYKYVTAINAMHATTRRTRVYFKEVADISYMPQSIYDTIDTVLVLHGNYKGIRIIDPLYIRLDMLRFFIYPFENPPREPILSRFDKIVKRFKLLDQYYPITYDSYSPISNIKTKLPPYSDKCVLTGLEAYDLYLKHAKWTDKKLLFNAYAIKNNTLESPEFLKPARFGNYFEDAELVKKGTIFNMFLETVQPQTIIYQNVEYYDLMHKQIVYTKIDGIQVITIYGLLLYFLRKAVLFPKKDPRRYLCFHAYNSVVKMIEDAEKAFLADGEKDYEKNPFLYQINVFGQTEKMYVEPLIKAHAELEDQQFTSILPQFTFSPAKYTNGQPMPEFDYSKSIKFAIDGQKRNI